MDSEKIRSEQMERAQQYADEFLTELLDSFPDEIADIINDSLDAFFLIRSNGDYHGCIVRVGDNYGFDTIDYDLWYSVGDQTAHRYLDSQIRNNLDYVAERMFKGSW